MILRDAHIHLFEAGYPNRYGPLGDEVRLYSEMRSVHGIGAALVVGYEGQSAFAGNNHFVLELSRRYSWVRPLCFHSCRERPAANWWRMMQANGSLGLVLYPHSRDDIEALSQWPAAFWRELSEAEALVSVNVSATLAADMGKYCRNAPGATWLFSHLGLPGSFDAVPNAGEVNNRLEGVLALAELPNTGVKISGLYTTSVPKADFPHAEATPVVAALHAAFGTDRLYWGSDFSPALGFVSMEQTILAVERLFPSPGEREQVMGGNLGRLLGC